jgi:hypothetical protein
MDLTIGFCNLFKRYDKKGESRSPWVHRIAAGG